MLMSGGRGSSTVFAPPQRPRGRVDAPRAFIDAAVNAAGIDFEP
jgi:hypothetical protein